jgi:hypothetical protein
VVHPDEVERRLRALGCYWGADMDDYHQIWITAWGMHITVPMIGRDRLCPQEDLQEIEDEVRRLRPK